MYEGSGNSLDIQLIHVQSLGLNSNELVSEAFRFVEQDWASCWTGRLRKALSRRMRRADALYLNFPLMEVSLKSERRLNPQFTIGIQSFEGDLILGSVVVERRSSFWRLLSFLLSLILYVLIPQLSLLIFEKSKPKVASEPPSLVVRFTLLFSSSLDIVLSRSPTHVPDCFARESFGDGKWDRISSLQSVYRQDSRFYLGSILKSINFPHKSSLSPTSWSSLWCIAMTRLSW